MDSDPFLPMKAGPVPDRLAIWPVDDGRYGLDATFQGASGLVRAEQHRLELVRDGVPHSFRQENDGSWTLRFGPLRVAYGSPVEIDDLRGSDNLREASQEATDRLMARIGELEASLA